MPASSKGLGLYRQKIYESVTGGKHRTNDETFDEQVANLEILDHSVTRLRQAVRKWETSLAETFRSAHAVSIEFREFYSSTPNQMTSFVNRLEVTHEHTADQLLGQFESFLTAHVYPKFDTFRAEADPLRMAVKEREETRLKFDYYRQKLEKLEVDREKLHHKGKLETGKQKERLDRNLLKRADAERLYTQQNTAIVGRLAAFWDRRFSFFDHVFVDVAKAEATLMIAVADQYRPLLPSLGLAPAPSGLAVAAAAGASFSPPLGPLPGVGGGPGGPGAPDEAKDDFDEDPEAAFGAQAALMSLDRLEGVPIPPASQPPPPSMAEASAAAPGPPMAAAVAVGSESPPDDVPGARSEAPLETSPLQGEGEPGEGGAMGIDSAAASPSAAAAVAPEAAIVLRAPQAAAHVDVSPSAKVASQAEAANPSPPPAVVAAVAAVAAAAAAPLAPAAPSRPQPVVQVEDAALRSAAAFQRRDPSAVRPPPSPAASAPAPGGAVPPLPEPQSPAQHAQPPLLPPPGSGDALRSPPLLPPRPNVQLVAPAGPLNPFPDPQLEPKAADKSARVAPQLPVAAVGAGVAATVSPERAVESVPYGASRSSAQAELSLGAASGGSGGPPMAFADIPPRPPPHAVGVPSAVSASGRHPHMVSAPIQPLQAGPLSSTGNAPPPLNPFGNAPALPQQQQQAAHVQAAPVNPFGAAPPPGTAAAASSSAAAAAAPVAALGSGNPFDRPSRPPPKPRANLPDFPEPPPSAAVSAAAAAAAASSNPFGEDPAQRAARAAEAPLAEELVVQAGRVLLDPAFKPPPPRADDVDASVVPEGRGRDPMKVKYGGLLMAPPSTTARPWKIEAGTLQGSLPRKNALDGSIEWRHMEFPLHKVMVVTQLDVPEQYPGFRFGFRLDIAHGVPREDGVVPTKPMAFCAETEAERTKWTGLLKALPKITRIRLGGSHPETRR